MNRAANETATLLTVPAAGGTRLRAASLTTLGVGVALLLARVAAAQTGPDELAEAARLAAHAQTLEDQCRYREASEWLKTALERLRGFRSTDLSQSHAAGSLLAQLEIRSRDLRGLPGSLDLQEAGVHRLVEAKRIESADRLLRQVLAPACEVRFTRLEQEVGRRQAESRKWVRVGQEALRRSDKKAAKDAFERAVAVNVEAPGASEGLQKARALAGGRHLGKVVAVLTVVGILGGGAYYGYYERQHTKQAGYSTASLVVSPR